MVHDGLWIAGHRSGNRISVSCCDVDHTRETIQDTQSNDRYVDEGYAAVFSENKRNQLSSEESRSYHVLRRDVAKCFVIIDQSRINQKLNSISIYFYNYLWQMTPVWLKRFTFDWRLIELWFTLWFVSHACRDHSQRQRNIADFAGAHPIVCRRPEESTEMDCLGRCLFQFIVFYIGSTAFHLWWRRRVAAIDAGVFGEISHRESIRTNQFTNKSLFKQLFILSIECNGVNYRIIAEYEEQKALSDIRWQCWWMRRGLLVFAVDIDFHVTICAGHRQHIVLCAWPVIFGRSHSTAKFTGRFGVCVSVADVGPRFWFPSRLLCAQRLHRTIVHTDYHEKGSTMARCLVAGMDPPRYFIIYFLHIHWNVPQAIAEAKEINRRCICVWTKRVYRHA